MLSRLAGYDVCRTWRRGDIKKLSTIILIFVTHEQFDLTAKT